ncbi:Ni,Fe-hydrogenase maturation factor [Halalkaliarchaeum sp. AArc-CO]|uniref:hydrogenase maturation protease n=1 Tax=unclassified Halalkaliarchaeum TaxID=2678344 RepID=UPI00217DE7B6|nr:MULTISPECIES: hydrogenase maturation protease [unclassified Halalkaliarchaeum]MDR5672179.1 hydrogenase maturation protease [Halalkaliarchaeum sp. AArc-GB]UWG51685.1 Ni,Fe-hydrogenase maturation factor [Halalkaliarchaeum sp. AArc-CO]
MTGSSLNARSAAAKRRDEIDCAEIAVVGVGNPIMGDDGVGKRVIDELETSSDERTNGVVLTHAGTTAFFALEAMSGCRKAIVVDAIETGAEPGTVHRYRYVDGAFAGEVPEMTMHDFSFAEALRAGRDAYDIPDELLVFGIEPARIEATLELSDRIERGVPELVDLVLEELATKSTRIDGGDEP